MHCNIVTSCKYSKTYKVFEEIPCPPPVEHNKRGNYQTRPKEVQDEANLHENGLVRCNGFSHPFMFSGLLKEPHPESLSQLALLHLEGACSHPHTQTISETINLLIRETLSRCWNNCRCPLSTSKDKVERFNLEPAYRVL